MGVTRLGQLSCCLCGDVPQLTTNVPTAINIDGQCVHDHVAGDSRCLATGRHAYWQTGQFNATSGSQAPSVEGFRGQLGVNHGVIRVHSRVAGGWRYSAWSFIDSRRARWIPRESFPVEIPPTKWVRLRCVDVPVPALPDLCRAEQHCLKRQLDANTHSISISSSAPQTRSASGK